MAFRVKGGPACWARRWLSNDRAGDGGCWPAVGLKLPGEEIRGCSGAGNKLYSSLAKIPLQSIWNPSAELFHRSLRLRWALWIPSLCGLTACKKQAKISAVWAGRDRPHSRTWESEKWTPNRASADLLITENIVRFYNSLLGLLWEHFNQNSPVLAHL